MNKIYLGNLKSIYFDGYNLTAYDLLGISAEIFKVTIDSIICSSRFINVNKAKRAFYYMLGKLNDSADIDECVFEYLNMDKYNLKRCFEVHERRLKSSLFYSDKIDLFNELIEEHKKFSQLIA